MSRTLRDAIQHALDDAAVWERQAEPDVMAAHIEKYVMQHLQREGVLTNPANSAPTIDTLLQAHTTLNYPHTDAIIGEVDKLYGAAFTKAESDELDVSTFYCKLTYSRKYTPTAGATVQFEVGNGVYDGKTNVYAPNVENAITEHLRRVGWDSTYNKQRLT